MENSFDTKYGLFIFGGLGDVSLTRKIPLLYKTDLRQEISLAGIFDVYPSAALANIESARNVLDDIAKRRLKAPLDDKIKEGLVRDIVSGKIAYFSSSESTSFLDGLEHIGQFGERAIVDISTPNKTHLKYLEESICKTGAHILIEKPVVSSRSELNGLAQLITKTHLNSGKRILMDAEHYSHYGQVRDYFSKLDEYSSQDKFGKINKMLIWIKETEGFENQRNRDIINRNISGGGIWMDLGIHAMSFISFLGGNVIADSISALPQKASDQIISEPQYGETSMEVKLNVFGEKFMDNAAINIGVGKKMLNKRKKICIEHESGHVVDLDFEKRKIAVYSKQGGEPIEERFYKEDAFYYVFKDFLECIHTQKSRHKFSASMQALENVFNVYDHVECLH